jgi:hypothetical protein
MRARESRSRQRSRDVTRADRPWIWRSVAIYFNIHRAAVDHSSPFPFSFAGQMCPMTDRRESSAIISYFGRWSNRQIWRMGNLSYDAFPHRFRQMRNDFHLRRSSSASSSKRARCYGRFDSSSNREIAGRTSRAISDEYHSRHACVTRDKGIFRRLLR